MLLQPTWTQQLKLLVSQQTGKVPLADSTSPVCAFNRTLICFRVNSLGNRPPTCHTRWPFGRDHSGRLAEEESARDYQVALLLLSPVGNVRVQARELTPKFACIFHAVVRAETRLDSTSLRTESV